MELREPAPHLPRLLRAGMDPKLALDPALVAVAAVVPGHEPPRGGVLDEVGIHIPQAAPQFASAMQSLLAGPRDRRWQKWRALKAALAGVQSAGLDILMS